MPARASDGALAACSASCCADPGGCTLWQWRDPALKYGEGGQGLSGCWKGSAADAAQTRTARTECLLLLLLLLLLLIIILPIYEIIHG